jgi:alpha-amylase
MNPKRPYPLLVALVFSLLFTACREKSSDPARSAAASDEIRTALQDPFDWNAATVYFLLTDRFKKGQSQATALPGRDKNAAHLRGFEGGNFAGITEKIEEDYFDRLGVDVIWLSPVVEQIHGITDEGTGPTYGYHGYWTRDWTAFEPSFGTPEEFKEMVEAAHKRGIRIMMDVVVNHTGPVTEWDPVWPSDWVRTEPTCQYTNYGNTTSCTLVDNLPDVLTESDEPVELPDALLSKWKDEGRLAAELQELDTFFDRTGYPRAPRFYIIKWLTDYVREFGIDGFRVDTVKHADEKAWSELKQEAAYAFENWKLQHPDKVLDNSPFFMVGEVYGYNISHGRDYSFGDRSVDYYDYGFDALINFEHKAKGEQPYEKVFSEYVDLLSEELKGVTVMNYLTSHDDAYSYDRERKRPFQAANLLLLSPGMAQIYYGDETARPLLDEKANGDASLRTPMNWDEAEASDEVREILSHWRKLGQFRRKHPAIGKGSHRILAETPYVFSRSLKTEGYEDRVAISLDAPIGRKSLYVKGYFADGTKLWEAYSEQEVNVKKGKVTFSSPYSTVLLEPKD